MLKKVKDILARFKFNKDFQDIKYEIEEYSNNYDNSNELNIGMCTREIGGFGLKRFVRFDSNKFDDLISELRNNPNCSYKTYINDLIINDNYTPEFLSVLMKMSKAGIFNSSNADYFIDAEVMASKLANRLEIPTVYNTKYKDNDYSYMLSVDVVEPDYKIHRISEIAYEPDMLSYTNIKHAVFLLFSTLDGNNEYGFHLKREDIKKILSEFIPMAMFRIETINDTDFFNNIFVMNKGKEWKLAPMLDFECSFVEPTKYEVIAEDAEYLLKNYPEEYFDYINRLRNIDFNEIKKEFQETFSVKKDAQMNFEAFKTNVFTILQVYDKLMKNRDFQTYNRWE